MNIISVEGKRISPVYLSGLWIDLEACFLANCKPLFLFHIVIVECRGCSGEHKNLHLSIGADTSGRALVGTRLIQVGRFVVLLADIATNLFLVATARQIANPHRSPTKLRHKLR